MKLLVAAPLVLFLAVGATFGVGLYVDKDRESPMRKAPLPAMEFAAVREDVPSFATSELKGRVSLLHFFASWCATCAEESGFMRDLVASGAAPPVYGVAWVDQPEKSAAWLDRYGNPYARVGDDAGGALGAELGVTGTPETYVVDAEGRVRLRHVGPLSPAIWEQEIAPLVRSLEQEAGS